MNAAPAIQTRDLVMQFPQQAGLRTVFKPRLGKIALDHINLEVPKGEIFGLLGPNGAGKTTLVKILSTLTIPTGGQACVAGLDVVHHSLEVRRRLGVVYGDERTFFWRLSAFDNLLFYASLMGIPAGVSRGRVAELLEMVGLTESAHLRMHHYSSGMRQRCSIARGLLNDPDILIMDEPTRSLDPTAAKELRELVKERVVNDRRTVLIATNIMAEAEFLCDRVAFLNHGQIQMIGGIEELREILQADEVHQIVVGGLNYSAIDALRRIPGVDSLKVITLGDDQVRLELGIHPGVATAVPEVIRGIVESGGDVWSCGRRQLTVEEMFTIVVERSHRKGSSEPEAVSA